MTSRLDVELVRRGLARSRTQAQELIRRQAVRVNRQIPGRPSHQVGPKDQLELLADRQYVSRAAHKLVGALSGSGLGVPSRVLDAGASTGGFTQVLLEAGAGVVYAVDVGQGQLAPELRADPRVVALERTNLRDLDLAHIGGEPVGLVVADVSFISLRLLLARLFGVLAPDGSALLLVKPQFEVGRAGLDDRGVVRSEELRRQASAAVVADAAGLGWRLAWQGESVLPGESGNIEHFVHLVPGV